MSKYKVGVSWEMYGYVTVEASSKEEAEKVAIKTIEEPRTCLPDGYYIEDSWEIDQDGITEVKNA